MAKIEMRQCPAGTRPYIIKAGDTLYMLARRFNTTVEAIVQVNTEIDPKNLQIGQRVCIPVGVPEAPETPQCPEGNLYTVKTGDTMYQIARRLKVSLDDLVKANPDIDPANLMPGQVICVPHMAPPVQCKVGQKPYQVKAGDTFYKIAQQFNVTLADLSDANPDVDPNMLQVGQTLCIPRTWATYRNLMYNVTFRYPSNWRRVDDLRYEGADGFFQLSAIASLGDLDAVCKAEAYHKLKPYGTEPRISRARIGGQEACFIYPSADQPAEMRNQAAIIVRYPAPVRINGVAYNYLILWVDQEYVAEIGRTLRFIE